MSDCSHIADNLAHHLILRSSAPEPPATTRRPTTFHHFPRLPAELRVQIWKLSIPPRIIYMDFDFIPKTFLVDQSGRIIIQKMNFRSSSKARDIPSISETSPSSRSTSTMHVPAALQTCHEARVELAKHYQREFSELFSKHPDFSLQNIYQRYSWINFDVDVINIVGAMSFKRFTSLAPSVQRLLLREIYESDTPSIKAGIQSILDTFSNAREIFIEPLRDVMKWRGAIDEFRWPCDKNNVWIFDKDFGVNPRRLKDL